jgi:hypothetical protein
MAMLEGFAAERLPFKSFDVQSSPTLAEQKKYRS